MFRIPRPVSDDPEAPDEFRTVLHTRDCWWRAGNGFHLSLGSALRVEFVDPVQRVLWWPYVTLAKHFGRYEVLYFRRDSKSWENWSNHFTQVGARYMKDKVEAALRDTEFKIVERTT